MRLLNALRPLVVTLWAGGLWTVGYLVAPLLFHTLEDRALAGTLAGRMFHAVGWMGIVCGAYLLCFELAAHGTGALRRATFWAVLAMFSLTLILQFWLQPFVASLRSIGAPVDALAAPSRHFALWHGVSSALYLLASLLALVPVLSLRKN